MTIPDQRIEVPAYGHDLPSDVALPTPYPEADELLIRIASGETSRVQIFTSNDLQLGDQVEQHAQRLHTEVYLERGYITPQQLDSDGVYRDKYAARSTTLFVKNGTKVAAGRMTRSDKKEGGLLSLPTTENFSVDPDALCEAADVNRVSDIKIGAARSKGPDKQGEIIEFGGLAARRQRGARASDADSVKALYARGLRISLEEGHKVWVQNVDPSFSRYLGGMIGGKEFIHVLGDKQEYMGPATVPIALNPQAVTKAILEGRAGEDSKAYLTEVLQGVEDRKLPKELRELMQENSIKTTEHSTWKRWANPKTALYAGSVGYTVIRDIFASQVEEFDGSLAELMALDVPLAFSYVWGGVEMVAGKSATRRSIGAAVAAASFAAPYIYFQANEKAGAEYPGYVNAIVGGIIGLAAVREVVTRVAGGKKERSLREQLQEAAIKH